MSISFVANTEVKVAISNKHLPKKNNKNNEDSSSQDVEKKLIQFSEYEIEILAKIDKLSELESSNSSPRESRIRSNKKDKVTEFTIPQIKKLKSELNDSKFFLCDLIDISALELKLPENEIVPRNPELEKRIQRLKAEQEQRTYENMTRNIDTAKARLPEDSIAFQCKFKSRDFACGINTYNYNNRFSKTYKSPADCGGTVRCFRTRRILVRICGH